MSKTEKQGDGGISRRQLLQGLGGGIAGGMLGGMFAKPASAKPIVLDASTSPIFDVSLPSGTSLIGEANLINGMLFVRTQANGLPDMQCFDVQSNQFAFSLSSLLEGGSNAIAPTPFTDPLSDGVFVYTANQQTLYQMDINGNSLQTMPVISGATGSVTTKTFINSNQDLLCWTDGGYFARFNVAAQQNVWLSTQSTDQLTNGIIPVIMVSGNVGYVYGNQENGANGGLFAIDLVSGTALNPTTPVVTVPKGTGASAAQGMIFISGANGVVTAHNPTTGTQMWAYPAGGATLSGPLLAPVCINNQVLVADASGILHAISQSTGLGSPTNLPSAPTPSSQIYVEDRFAYLSLGSAGNLTAFAISLDPTNPATLSYPTQSAGVFVGVQNGVCYFSHNSGQNLAARSFTADLHGLFSESVLIEDYLSSSAGTVRTPSYRTHLQFLDTNYNPRAYKSVRIWASDTTQISSGQNTYTVDTTTGVWLTTDGAGELAIIVTPDNITCPNLYVWNTYMLPGDAMMIYPDWDTTNTLANMQSSNMPAINPWDKTTPLFSQVNGTDDIASSIRSSMSGGSQPTAVRAKVKQQIAQNKTRIRTGHTTPLRATDENSYIAYPSANPNMSFAPNYQMVDPTRPFVASAPSPWTISLVNGVWTYSNTVSTTLAVGSFFKISFKDLLKKCVQAATEVLTKVEATVDSVTNAITHVITTIANDVVQVYQLTIDSLEAAAAVVSSVLTSALKDIQQAVQWLSYLFEWSDIIATQVSIANQVTTRLQTFASTIQSYDQGVVADIQAAIVTVSNDIEGFLNKLVAGTVGSFDASQSLQSHQINNNNPQTAYNAHGAQSCSQTKWMSTKLQTNAGQATAANTGLGDSSNDIYTAFLNLLSSIGGILEQSQFTHIPGDIKTLFESFSNLWKDPSKFVEQSVTAIVSLVIDFIVGFLQLLGAIVESLLLAIPAILNAIISMLATPLNIPVISDIWKAIDNGNPLTMLNAVALVVAIPTTIISKLLSSTSKAGVGSDSNLAVALVFAGMIYAGVDSVSDLENASSSGFAAFLGLSMSAISLGCGAPLDPKPTNFIQSIYYIMSGVSLALSGISFSVDKLGPAAQKELWSLNLPGINFLYGVIMAPFTLLVGLGDSSFLGLFPMLANFFGYLPYVGKMTATGPAFEFPQYPERGIAAAVDFAGDFTSAVLNTVGNFG
jgi:hypothetical protein